MNDRDTHPSDRLREASRDLLPIQDRLDDLGMLLAVLGCPDSASRAAAAGDAIEALRATLAADADRLSDREDRRDRRLAVADAGGVSADAIADPDGEGSP